MLTKSLRTLLAVVLFAALSAPGAIAQAKDAPEEMTGLKVGEKAPEFTLKDQNGDEHTLKSLVEKEGTTVLVFYRSADW